MGGIYATIVELINNYTGLSPTSFIVITVLTIITYKVVCTMFVAANDYKSVQEMKQIFEQDITRESVQLGEVTSEQLQEYDGKNPNKPLLMAIKGQIYDVSRGRMFYGPGGPYAMFAGRDATRALALMSFDPQDLNGDTEGLSESELDVLQDWELKFMEKYPKVGVLVGDRTSDQPQSKAVEVEAVEEPSAAAVEEPSVAAVEEGEEALESKKAV